MKDLMPIDKARLEEYEKKRKQIKFRLPPKPEAAVDGDGGGKQERRLYQTFVSHASLSSSQIDMLLMISLYIIGCQYRSTQPLP